MPYIAYEKISKLTDATIIKLSEKSELMNKFIQRTMNTLCSSSLLSSFLQFFMDLNKDKSGIGITEVPAILGCTLCFCSKIFVYLERNEYDRKSQISQFLEQLKISGLKEFTGDVNI